MDENKKYSIIGKVEIGTDEYRDLIEAVKEAECEAREYRNKFWSEADKVKKLEKSLEELKTKYDLLLEVTNTEEITLERFMAYKKEV